MAHLESIGSTNRIPLETQKKRSLTLPPDEVPCCALDIVRSSGALDNRSEVCIQDASVAVESGAF